METEETIVDIEENITEKSLKHPLPSDASKQPQIPITF